MPAAIPSAWQASWLLAYMRATRSIRSLAIFSITSLLFGCTFSVRVFNSDCRAKKKGCKLCFRACSLVDDFRKKTVGGNPTVEKNQFGSLTSGFASGCRGWGRDSDPFRPLLHSMPAGERARPVCAYNAVQTGVCDLAALAETVDPRPPGALPTGAWQPGRMCKSGRARKCTPDGMLDPAMSGIEPHRIQVSGRRFG